MKKPLLLLVILLLLQACASSRYERYQGQSYQGRMMVASWYGKDFHGKPTASGEIFDMYDFTAAHKALPFGTKLRITNPENRRSVIVKINDRGPFVRGRDIDLSYGAARKIGIIQKGTARVLVDNVGRDMTYVRAVKYISTAGPFTLQIASFKDIGNARRLKAILETGYSSVYIMKAWIKGKMHYRVRIGRFSDRKDANRIAGMLSAEGYRVLITRYEEVL